MSTADQNGTLRVGMLWLVTKGGRYSLRDRIGRPLSAADAGVDLWQRMSRKYTPSETKHMRIYADFLCSIRTGHHSLRTLIAAEASPEPAS
jgi:hypothetical protein